MKFFSFISLFTLLLFISACSSSDAITSENKKSCPKCNMTLPTSNIHTAKLEDDSKSYYFDDFGCLVLWAKEKNISLVDKKIEVFSNDTKRYIDAKAAYFIINDKTPMSYGFGAYENEVLNSIKVEEVELKMLRGEHMANPKIRKQILGQ
ncbi:conserved hypothetical protein [Sulfurimonas denitrificans DSM 1251]|uniref:Uncharacterized protein n=1 Tax=Sulfurimonas denitrificans (strain ATCC 33889 / DSM 1251) TaxID=326298 RepID=Q30QZ7_SULDN|nr:hypothetical protein [Sulfurimonas denitrificans]ABB44584.1 conserved hypothetical protein [Sulfurimonas denitrificans DSM 1251]MDD3441768.1 hypothetical protein [Sulfurimonas denitrificans]